MLCLADVFAIRPSDAVATKDAQLARAENRSDVHDQLVLGFQLPRHIEGHRDEHVVGRPEPFAVQKVFRPCVDTVELKDLAAPLFGHYSGERPLILPFILLSRQMDEDICPHLRIRQHARLDERLVRIARDRCL